VSANLSYEISLITVNVLIRTDINNGRTVVTSTTVDNDSFTSSVEGGTTNTVIVIPTDPVSGASVVMKLDRSNLTAEISTAVLWDGGCTIFVGEREEGTSYVFPSVCYPGSIVVVNQSYSNTVSKIGVFETTLVIDNGALVYDGTLITVAGSNGVYTITSVIDPRLSVVVEVSNRRVTLKPPPKTLSGSITTVPDVPFDCSQRPRVDIEGVLDDSLDVLYAQYTILDCKYHDCGLGRYDGNTKKLIANEVSCGTLMQVLNLKVNTVIKGEGVVRTKTAVLNVNTNDLLTYILVKIVMGRLVMCPYEISTKWALTQNFNTLICGIARSIYNNAASWLIERRNFEQYLR